MSNRSAMLAMTGCLALMLAACGSSNGTAGAGSGTSTPPASGVTSAAASDATTTRLPSTSSVASSPVDTARAAAFCEQGGGEVQTRAAFWGTNGDEANWLPLAGSNTMCRFQADDDAHSRIYVDLTTLSSPVPTLAALAYLSKVPMPTGSGGGNPATGYCSKELGGSSTFGAVGASGGGWVAKADPDDIVVALCVFPDLSFIDEWGLAYHSDGSIRGTDLATVMAYQPDGQLPPVFPTGSAGPTS